MKKTWEKRIRKLESTLQSRARPPMVCHYGYVRYLPQGTEGERTIAIAKSQSTALPNVQRCEFEERVGRAPEPRDDLTFIVYLSVEDKNGSSPSR